MSTPTISKITASEPLATSTDIVAANIAKLKALFPALITEGERGNSVNLDVLKQLVGDQTLTDAEEKFGLNWHGKRKTRQLAFTPSTGTLRPCPDESVDWHTTQNLLIEGDNLEVLKLLQKPYAGRIKMIYIDPPYNTGRDLLYPNDFADGVQAYLEVTGQIAGDAKLTSNTSTGGRYHTNWLNMMYARLLLARNLLTHDGVLVCTIDENEQVNLGALLREVFTEGTYEHVCVTIVHNPRGVQGTNFSYTHEYAFFVFPSGVKAIGDRKLKPDEVQWSQFRNWGSESERTDARNCFYPVLVRDGQIVGFGDVCKDDFHPRRQTERIDGVDHVYPIDREGTERKWRYARQSVEAIRHLLRVKKGTDGGHEIEIGKDFGMYRTVWTDKRYDANEYGTQIVSQLVADSPFSFPKSLWAVYDTLFAVVGDDKEALVLDFFAGSGTTGHAVLEMNKNDGGRRRFILVQLPEPIDGHRKYKTIADVTRTRMRGAGAAIKAQSPLWNGDAGFRAFRLDSSNVKAWLPEAKVVAEHLEDYVTHVKAERAATDLLYELLLKRGLDLCVPIESKGIANKQVHSVGAGSLIACLDTEISRADGEALAMGIAQWHKSMNPAGDTAVVFRDDAFADDVVKTNVAAILEQHGLKNVRSI